MNLLLLHGAIGAAQLNPLATELQKDYTIHTLDFSGHGSKPFPEGPYSISLFAKDVLQYMDDHRLEKNSNIWLQHGRICRHVSRSSSRPTDQPADNTGLLNSSGTKPSPNGNANDQRGKARRESPRLCKNTGTAPSAKGLEDGIETYRRSAHQPWRKPAIKTR